MKTLSKKQLMMVDGGGKLKEYYEDARDFINNNLGDLVRGIKDGWNSL